MYTAFYGLRNLPFELTLDPRFRCFTASQQEALATLEYGLTAAKPITVLTGEAGTGKTTLLHAALDSARRRRSVYDVSLYNPTLTASDFLELMARHLALGLGADAPKGRFLEALEATLRERRDQGETVALLVDEAQGLSLEVLEEIRLIANVETATEKLLPVVLAGHPEFADRLNEAALRQLKQRVTLRCRTELFTLAETAAYIASRIRVAGGDTARLFTREAVTLIHAYAKGIPRTVNVICDNALLNGFALNRQPVDCAIVIEVCRDLDLDPPQPQAELTRAATAGDPPLAPSMAVAGVGYVRALRKFMFFDGH
jgi:type II secretory pathway predicted ATPase ExeA